jgi:hypothetical protein
VRRDAKLIQKISVFVIPLTEILDLDCNRFEPFTLDHTMENTDHMTVLESLPGKHP